MGQHQHASAFLTAEPMPRLRRPRVTTDSKWTPELCEKLKEKWIAGEYAHDIGKDLGFSKNAIIGKIARQGWSHLAPAWKRNKGPRVRRSAPQKTCGRHVAGKIRRAAILQRREKIVNKDGLCDLPHDQSPFAVSFEDLAERHCRWPLGEPGSSDFKFCGDERFPASSYCPRHCLAAYR